MTTVIGIGDYEWEIISLFAEREHVSPSEYVARFFFGDGCIAPEPVRESSCLCE